MKFLLDTVFTQRPRTCSTHYLMWQLVEDLLNWRDDTFCYVLYPPHKVEGDSEEQAFLSRYPDRVTLLPLPQSVCDRTSELYMLRNKLRYYLNPWSRQTWDADVVISSRIPVLKHFAVHSSRPRILTKTGGFRTTRLYVGLEEMPVLPFRPTVSWFDDMYPDTLLSYAMTDVTLINNLWTKELLKPVLREVFSPAWGKRILNRLHEVIPVKVERLEMRDTLYRDGEPFELAFVGRMTGTHGFDEVMKVFRAQFAYPLGKNRAQIQFRVSTNSYNAGSVGVDDLDFLDIQRNDRAQFHTFLEHAHLAVNLAQGEDFSLSTYETLRAGVPVIVPDEPWTGFLGPTYPFRAKGLTEVFALVSACVENYGAYYALFRAWEDTHWRAFVDSPSNTTTGEKLIEVVTQFAQARDQALNSPKPTGAPKVQAYRAQAESLVPDAEGRINLTDYLTVAPNGNVVMFDAVDDTFSFAVGRRPDALVLKLLLLQQGYQETNSCGVLQSSAKITA